MSTPRRLRTGRRDPGSGRARNVVVFLHGYGANGADLLGLAELLAPHMPDTLFLAPDAPEACYANPMGFQWFPIPWIDGSSEIEAMDGLERAARDIDGFLDEVSEESGVSDNNIMIIGFSQGTMLALHVAPRRASPVAGVVGFSGRLLAPERLAIDTVSRPPVVLLHGDADEVVPPQSLGEAAGALRDAGFATRTHVMRGTGHGIAPDGLSVALDFMRAHLKD